jgi:hypothetical protein
MHQRLAELKQQQKSMHLDGLVRGHRFKAVSAYQGQNVYLFLENSPFQCNFSYVLAPYAPAVATPAIAGGSNSNANNNDTEYLMLAMDVPKVPGVIPAPTRGCFFTQCTGLDCSFGQRTAMNRLGQTFSKVMLAGWGFSGDYVVMPQVLSVPNINNNYYPAGLVSPSSIVVETNDFYGTLQTEMQLNGIELMNAILWQVPEM